MNLIILIWNEFQKKKKIFFQTLDLKFYAMSIKSK